MITGKTIKEIIGISLLCISLFGCGGGGSSGEGNDCLSNDRNCSTDNVDIVSAIQYAADNGISIVHVRWAGCCNDNRYSAVSAYAASLGVSVIFPAGDSRRVLELRSPDVLVVGSGSENSNIGPAIDVVYDKAGNRGTVHGGLHAVAIAVKLYDTYSAQEAQQRLMSGNYVDWALDDSCTIGKCRYPDPADRWQTNRTVMIVDNGFDDIRPLYVVYNNPMLVGQITGDFGIKAISELYQWLDGVQVVGYVPFNTLPANPRIDNWQVD